jgi:ADP-ribose pyrophosphatase YjhB (NUDIX family)
MGRVLLVKRADNGEWEIPGGVVALDEELHDALRREVHEETGLRVQPGRLTGVYKNMSLGILALVFECSLLGGQVEPGDESAAVTWAEPSQLHDLAGPRICTRIDDASANSLIPAVRGHSHPVPTR